MSMETFLDDHGPQPAAMDEPRNDSLRRQPCQVRAGLAEPRSFQERFADAEPVPDEMIERNAARGAPSNPTSAGTNRSLYASLASPR
jgi:hypothetical protein